MLFRTLILLIVFLAGPVAAERRVALIVGNSAYEHATPLANPVNDATKISEKLRGLGFEVLLRTDLRGQDFRIALGEFTEAALGADVALVYYAGHGIEMSGKNYLIPTDSEMRSEMTAQFETVDLDQVMSAVQGAKSLGIVMLDACRDNPFAKSMQRRDASRAVSRGLAAVPLDRQSSILVSFAAEAGRTADDGDTGHSPYAEAFLELLGGPQMEVGRLFRSLRSKVREKTNGKQIPVEEARLPDYDVFLTAAAPSVPVAPPVQQPVVAAPASPPAVSPTALFFEAARTNDRKLLTDFIAQFPTHERANDARKLLETIEDDLMRQEVSVAASEASLRRYLLIFPNGIHADEAAQKIAAMATPVPTTPAVPQYTAAELGNCPKLTGGGSVGLVPSNDTLFLRSGPGTGYRQIGELPYNAVGVDIKSCANKWCTVSYGCLSGFASQKYLTTGPSQQPPSAYAGRYSLTNLAGSQRFSLRAGPGENYVVVAALPATVADLDVVDCQAKSGNSGWCFVSWNQNSGWISSALLLDSFGHSPLGQGAARAQTPAAAVFLGTPRRSKPSFNCALASTAVERAICGSEELAFQDQRLLRAYNAALSKGRVSKTAQREWVFAREAQCSGASDVPTCVHGFTNARISDLGG